MATDFRLSARLDETYAEKIEDVRETMSKLVRVHLSTTDAVKVLLNYGYKVAAREGFASRGKDVMADVED